VDLRVSDIEEIGKGESNDLIFFHLTAIGFRRLWIFFVYKLPNKYLPHKLGRQLNKNCWLVLMSFKWSYVKNSADSTQVAVWSVVSLASKDQFWKCLIFKNLFFAVKKRVEETFSYNFHYNNRLNFWNEGIWFFKLTIYSWQLLTVSLCLKLMFWSNYSYTYLQK
jgi:hypothetical protein